MHLSRASVAAVPACLAVVAGCAARLRTRASRRSGSRRPSRGAKALIPAGRTIGERTPSGSDDAAVYRRAPNRTAVRVALGAAALGH